jgi:nucleoside-diphosphate-sugar epimerase
MNFQNFPGVGGKILVTGGTGFIGSYIIKELIGKGYSVRAIHRSNKLPFLIPAEVYNKVEWVNGDVLDIVSLDDAMHGIDAVIHSAAVISFFKKERKQMYQVNVEGTANVVNLALDHGMKRLVHVSSISAIGRTMDGEHVSEEKKWTNSKLNTHYGISKYKSEMEVWRGMGEGLSAVIINPSTVLGYGDWHNGSCAIFKNVYNEFPWYTKGINGFVDVEDVARVAVLLMESRISEERFIVSGENKEFRKLFDTIADGFGKKHPDRNANPLLGGVAWRMEKLKSLLTGKKPLLTKETAKIAQSKTYWSNEKILKALPGFSFMPMDKSIQAACQKYLDAVAGHTIKV